MLRYFYIIIPILFASCIKEVNYDIQPLPQKVVVNGLFCPDSIFRIHVSLTSSTDAVPNYISNASVEIFKENVSIGILGHTEKGWYQTGVKPTAGSNYTLKVSVPNFEQVVAKSSVPVFPTILSAIFYITSMVPDNSNAPGIGGGQLPTDAKIVFKDDPETLNYYEVGVNKFRYETTQETDLSILADSELDFSPRTLFFSDELFNGTDKSLVLRKEGYASITPSGDLFADPQSNLKFKTCSSEYYRFRKSWTKHVFNQNSDLNLNDPITLIFIGDPVEMYSNVSGGLGVFAGYNQNILTVLYEE